MRRLFHRQKTAGTTSTGTTGDEATTEPSRVFPSGIKQLHVADNCIVDIVFIHGLTGDRERTWRAKNASAPWPQTLLAAKIPDARILTFGYDAYMADWRGMVSQSRVANHAWNLLTSLSTWRDEDDTNERPIIFVCHSLGGLVCEDALVTSNQRSEPHLGSILSSTRGIVFLGTPHHGAGLARWAEMLAKTIGYIKQTNTEIVRVLKQDSEVLGRIRDSFHAMLKSRARHHQIRITCFYEELPLPGVGHVVPQHSAVLPGYVSIGIRANHKDMARFCDMDDPGFIAVYGELRRWTKELRSGLESGVAKLAEVGHDEPRGAEETEHIYSRQMPISTPSVARKGSLVGRSSSSASPGLSQGSARQRDGSPLETAGKSAPGHWVVPFGRNRDFVGREPVLAQLLEMIPPAAEEDDCQRTAVEGLGGIGKTQIVLEAAFQVRDSYPDCSIFWVPTVDVASFENAYREIGRKLQIPGIEESRADIKALVKVALGSESTGSWLLIVDNADDTELLFSNMALSDHLPFSRKGSILFTTRNHETTIRLTIPKRNIITVPEMSGAEALELLRRDLDEGQMHDAQATECLLDFLANLPLAIRQASAYMAKKGMSTSRYLDHCRSSDKALVRLLSNDFEDRNRYKAIENPVATTWLISFNQLSRDAPLAAHFLRFMSLLAEKDIPISLLPAEEDLDVDDAIGMLRAYAFITQRGNPDSYDLHRLVRLAMRNWLEVEGELESSVISVIRQLAERYPLPEYSNKDTWMRYLPHALSALEIRSNTAKERAVTVLLSRAGKSLDIVGKYREAERLFREEVEWLREASGEEHPDTLVILGNLAIVLLTLGKHEEAEQIGRRLLAVWTKLFGEAIDATLTSMNNLACILQDQETFSEAEELHRQMLRLRKTVLGAEHPQTLSGMNNLTPVLSAQGNHDAAEQMHRRTLETWKKVLGEAGHHTLNIMNNLALILTTQGNYKEAMGMYQHTVEAQKEISGEEHPDTLKSMSNLALVLASQGKYEEAQQINRRTTEALKKVLGEEHPDTLVSIHNLAHVFAKQENYEEAEGLYRHIVEIRKRVLGEGHLDALKSMNNLAFVLTAQGKYEEAEQMIRTTTEALKEVVGEEHPETLRSMGNLEHIFGSQEKYEEAEGMAKHNNEVRKRVLGEEAPRHAYQYTQPRTRPLQARKVRRGRGLIPTRSRDTEENLGRGASRHAH